MTTLHLRFPDVWAAAAALSGYAEAGVTIDAIGEIDDATGWHVNVRRETEAQREALAAYVIHPTQPVRVFL